MRENHRSHLLGSRNPAKLMCHLERSLLEKKMAVDLHGGKKHSGYCFMLCYYSAPLYKKKLSEEVRRIIKRLEIHYMPKHGN